MNALIKRVIGEADIASPTERQALEKGLQSGPTTDDEGQEIQLAQQILAAVKSGDKQTVIQAASEIIKMHQAPAAPAAPAGGGHVQPVGGGMQRA